MNIWLPLLHSKDATIAEEWHKAPGVVVGAEVGTKVGRRDATL